MVFTGRCSGVGHAIDTLKPHRVISRTQAERTWSAAYPCRHLSPSVDVLSGALLQDTCQGGMREADAHEQRLSWSYGIAALHTAAVRKATRGHAASLRHPNAGFYRRCWVRMITC